MWSVRDDSRPIREIVLSDGRWYAVGGGYTKIEPYHEDDCLWFAVRSGDDVCIRVNASFVISIWYGW